MIQNALLSGGVQSGLTAPSYEASGTPLSAAPVLSGGGGEVSEAAFNRALEQMLAAAPGKIKINSGKRTREHQERLWQEALAKYGDPEIADNWVARPGNSRHETGIAADLGYVDDALRQWAHENAAKFGLHFPLSNEPWHIELLGSR